MQKMNDGGISAAIRDAASQYHLRAISRLSVHSPTRRRRPSERINDQRASDNLLLVYDPENP
jgi:hypothetical protein